MKIRGSRVMVTGATGGIGGAIARRLARDGAALTLVGRDGDKLAVMIDTLPAVDGVVHRRVIGDLSLPGEPQRIAEAALANGSIDILVNCAGVQNFGFFEDESPAAVEALFRTNLLGAVLLINAVLPHMLDAGQGQIVNVGSIFGSIGFPCFASYSASKFALRGFSEALRRELADSCVNVTYVAPRYTRTALNGSQVSDMADALGMKQDEPGAVADQVIAAIARDDRDCYIGWPEKLFVRINALLPRLVDGSLLRQLARMRPFAAGRPAG